MQIGSHAHELIYNLHKSVKHLDISRLASITIRDQSAVSPVSQNHCTFNIFGLFHFHLKTVDSYL